MADEARPATFDDLKQLLAALHRCGADYLLVGAYAMAAHGYRRATTDIDLLVPTRAEAGDKLREALLSLPEQVAKEFDPAWLSEGENVRIADAFVVDLLVTANGHGYEDMLRHEQRLELDGIPVRTLNLEGLLLTKQTLRDKDVQDRLMLERAVARERQGDS